MTPFRIATGQPVLDRIAAKVADTRIGYAPSDDDQWGRCRPGGGHFAALEEPEAFAADVVTFFGGLE